MKTAGTVCFTLPHNTSPLGFINKTQNGAFIESLYGGRSQNIFLTPW